MPSTKKRKGKNKSPNRLQSAAAKSKGNAAKTQQESSSKQTNASAAQASPAAVMNGTSTGQRAETVAAPVPVQQTARTYTYTPPAPPVVMSEVVGDEVEGAEEGGVVKLNVGGRPFATTRTLLCSQPDTHLAAMFSGRWEGGHKRDPETDAICLDLHPTLFALLLDHLRALQKKQTAADTAVATPPVCLPIVPADLRGEWGCMCAYLGVDVGYVEGDVSVFSDTCAHARTTISVSPDKKTATVTSPAVPGQAYGMFGNVVCGGVVRKGGVCTWTLRMINTSTVACGNDMMFGVISDTHTHIFAERPLDGFAGLPYACLFCHEGDYIPAKITDTNVTEFPVPANYQQYKVSVSETNGMSRFWRLERGMMPYLYSLPHNTVFKLCLDTRDREKPVIYVPTHTIEQAIMPLPVEWEGFRMVVRLAKVGVGVEILSVEERACAFSD